MSKAAQANGPGKATTATTSVVPLNKAEERMEIAPAILEPQLARDFQQLEIAVVSYKKAIELARGTMAEFGLMGKAMLVLRDSITPPIMEIIMGLMNSPNGFMTDKPSKGDPSLYSAVKVKEAFITSLLAGLRPVNNEWNIIAGKCMPVLNGCKRKFEEIPGISNIRMAVGRPVPQDGFTCFRVSLSWKLGGVYNELRNEKNESGMIFTIAGQGGIDALSAKAMRRAYKVGYQLIMGSFFHEEEEAEILPGEIRKPEQGSRTDTLAQKMIGSKNATRIRQLFMELGISDVDWYDIATTLHVPGDVNILDAAQQKLVIEHLEKMKLDYAKAERDERDAIE